jgi:hypothetical protein
VALEHRVSRIVDQRPEVVHRRLLELAARLRDELPPVEPGTQVASLLGISGPVGVEIDDRGPGRLELRTTRGRIRGAAIAELTPTAADRTNVTLSVTVVPEGFAANVVLGVALKTMPEIERRLAAGLEAALADLATELAKPEDEWDARAWTPPNLPP